MGSICSTSEDFIDVYICYKNKKEIKRTYILSSIAFKHTVFQVVADGFLALISTREGSEICLNGGQKNSEQCSKDSNGSPGAPKMVAHHFSNPRCYPGLPFAAVVFFDT